MLDKLGTAVKAILADLKGVKADVNRLKVRPVPKDGTSPNASDIVKAVLAEIPTPKDGTSPDVAEIVKAVLAEIPTPKDGTSPDIDAVSFKVLSQIPKPKDGTSPDAADIVKAVLAEIPTPKNGTSPDANAIVKEVLAQIPPPQAAEPLAPVKGEKGKPGVSVTKVKLEKGNKLAVWLDGVRRVVGTIELPKIAEAFTPGDTGGGTRRTTVAPPETAGYTSQGSFFSEALQEGATDTPKTVQFGAGGSTNGGRATVGVDGTVTINAPSFWSIKQRFRAGRAGASGVSEIFFWVEISADDGDTWNVLGNSVDIALNNSSDTVVFFDISDIQVPAGTKLRNRFARSGTGDDSGDLRVGVPSAALQAIGVQPAPSAQITFYEIVQ